MAIIPSIQGTAVSSSSTSTCTGKISSMPYAIDAELCNKGRRFPATKRRVKFSFGFGNMEAIANGLSSSDCRGEEHQVVMIWSLTSGKQRVLADGIEVHFSRSTVTGKFECQWTMKSGHHITVMGAWSPLKKDPRSFDLRIDGLSFWDMPKIYQLGRGGPRQPSLPQRRRTLAEIPSPQLSSCSSSTCHPQQQQQQQQNQLQRLPHASPASVAVVWDDFVLSNNSNTKINAAHPYAPLLPKQPFTSTGMNQDSTKLDRALQSLINMESSPSSSQSVTESPLIRRPSYSDLSVQSAYATTQPSLDYSLRSYHRSISCSSHGVPTGLHSSHPHTLYSFAS